MRITNKHNLPPSIFNAIKYVAELYDNGGSNISASSINIPVRIYWLNKRYGEEVEVDATSLYRSFIGSCLHYFCEVAGKDDPDLILEERYFTTINGWVLSAQIDRYDKKEKELTDLKFPNIFSLNSDLKEDYIAQLNTQRYLLHLHGLDVKGMNLDVSAVDWYESRAIQKDYPKCPSKTIKVKKWSLKDTKKFIEDKISLLKSHENTPDDELPLCTDSDRWRDPTKYAVIKKGNKRATKIHDCQLEAEIHAKQIGGYVDERKGTDKRCIRCCPVSSKCSYFKEMGYVHSDGK